MKLERKQIKRFMIYSLMVLLINIGFIPVYATSSDPLTVINNLSEFMFGLVRGIGMIMLGFGIVQIGLSLKSHDPQIRANGFMTFAGGLVITFAKEILNIVIGG